MSLFCHDYSYWRNRSCSNGSFTPIPGISAPYGSCSNGENHKNIIEDQNSCLEKKWHFCQKSKECIKKDWVCDGAVQCFYGEDESFEICQNKFPEGATFKCIEGSRSHFYNLTIFATPCDGICECAGCEDEQCDPNWILYVKIGTPIFFAIFLLWGITYILALGLKNVGKLCACKNM